MDTKVRTALPWLEQGEIKTALTEWDMKALTWSQGDSAGTLQRMPGGNPTSRTDFQAHEQAEVETTPSEWELKTVTWSQSQYDGYPEVAADKHDKKLGGNAKPGSFFPSMWNDRNVQEERLLREEHIFLGVDNDRLNDDRPSMRSAPP